MRVADRTRESVLEDATSLREAIPVILTRVITALRLPWVERNLTFGERMARAYMQVASNRQRVTDMEPTSLHEALRLPAEPEEEKQSLPHGSRLPWIEWNLTFGRRQATRYMMVAEANGTRVSHLEENTSLREALRLLSEPEEEKPEAELEFRNDPELQKRASDAELTIKRMRAEGGGAR